ncbi:uncharacterized protein ACA1_018130 [Acanthamoeba castellanii str. Neff]|uniref:Uncharacterized protein n=1 Tax=Acanthamoeba castellanii (strain ATCC 30010 / Neff) TaxID=1257118 RepID=L8GLM6_ACACF|nr:uncharacterized protein ACA1_018130 [Acanthamoeba castellanii str. Neff]ELR13744.1 hypothetical protein ACA1_018130 [Acanthamoeba castellanii str. Neff]
MNEVATTFTSTKHDIITRLNTLDTMAKVCQTASQPIDLTAWEEVDKRPLVDEIVSLIQDLADWILKDA